MTPAAMPIPRGSSTLGQGARALPPPRFTCCPPSQIQKLAGKYMEFVFFSVSENG